LSLAWLGALCVVFVRGGPEIPRNFVVLVGPTTVIIAKSAFGRFDMIHFCSLLGLIVVAVAISPPFRIRRRALVTAAVAIAYVFTQLGGVSTVTARVEAAVSTLEEAGVRVATLALPGCFGQHIAQSKARQRALYAIPDRFIHTIGSGTVHIDTPTRPRPSGPMTLRGTQRLSSRRTRPTHLLSTT
jgi:hypothetical protein